MRLFHETAQMIKRNLSLFIVGLVGCVVGSLTAEEGSRLESCLFGICLYLIVCMMFTLVANYLSKYMDN